MLNEIRIKIAEFLGTPLVEKSYFYFDSWTLIHIFSGFIVMLFIFKFFRWNKNSPKLALLFFFLVFWEIFELSSSWIKLESSIDIIYDLIMGMFGGWLFYFFKNKFKILQ